MANNQRAHALLQEKIRQLRELAKTPEKVAPAVAKEVERELKKQVAEGKDPGGRAWKKTKEGKQPLKRAAGAIKIKAIGSVVTIKLTGHHARHHLGAVRGKVKRQIIPTRRLPDPMTKAIKRVITKHFKETMGG